LLGRTFDLEEFCLIGFFAEYIFDIGFSS